MVWLEKKISGSNELRNCFIKHSKMSFFAIRFLQASHIRIFQGIIENILYFSNIADLGTLLFKTSY